MELQKENSINHSKLKPYQKWLCFALVAGSMLLTACGKDDAKKSFPMPTAAPIPYVVDSQDSGVKLKQPGDVANPGKQGK